LNIRTSSWYRAPKSLLGNEKVDKEARSAANSETFDDTTLEYQDFRTSIATYEKQKVE
jgi:hypothetical protein